jgi:hypothetical protein
VVSDKSVGDISAPRVAWETKPVDITADAATYAAFQASGRASSGTFDRKPTSQDEAIEFLRERLADGPVSADEMFATADEDGIAKITLKRAKKRLGVVSKPDGFQGKILWSLRSEDHGGSVGIISEELIPIDENDPHWCGMPDWFGMPGRARPVAIRNMQPVVGETRPRQFLGISWN